MRAGQDGSILRPRCCTGAARPLDDALSGSTPQVDFLFGKMAAKRERSTLDTTKLLDLLLRLARSDEQVR